MTKNQRREKRSKPKAVILVPTPTNSVLKYLILLLQRSSNLKSISDVNGNSFPATK